MTTFVQHNDTIGPELLELDLESTEVIDLLWRDIDAAANGRLFEELQVVASENPGDGGSSCSCYQPGPHG